MSFGSTIIAIHYFRTHRSLFLGPFFTTAFLQMGGSTSKPTTTLSPIVDLTRGATVSLEAANQAQLQIQQQLAAASAQATAAVSSYGWLRIGAWLLLAGLVIFGLLALYEYIALKTGAPQIPGPINNLFSVHIAMYDTTDVTNLVTSKINASTGSLNIPADLSTNLGVPKSTNMTPLSITYQFPGESTVYTAKYKETDSVNISSTSRQGNPVSATGPTQSSAPASSPQQQSLLSRIWASLSGGGSSGNLLSSLHDATGSGMVQATSAPLSSQDQGAYGMQWWMFIKDWNYGYGKDKPVLNRPDPTSGAVMNPSISLHPTDNSLKVTVSLFPSGEGGSKTEPAPAGSSGSATDDVYVCEVHNLPLQAWFSVGVTVFGRNLDVYIDGKLVKSCFLPGVPKPATGDIQLSPGGGFSGYLCDFFHYPRMLTPGDAIKFFSSGTSCKNKVPAAGESPGTSSTGYSVKFGVYDTLGKQVQEYSF